MIIIGECIHVLSKKVKTAIETRDAATIQELAAAQAKNGAGFIDLNIGPSRKTGVEVMQWMVDIVQEAAPGGRLSLDPTNAAAIEAGLQRAKVRCLINSTDATEARLNAMMPLAAKYDADIIALTLGDGLDSAIIDALDGEMLEVIRILDQRDASTPLGQLYLGIYDAYAAGDLFDNSGVDTSNEDLRAVVKTVEALENRWIYAHSYLRL